MTPRDRTTRALLAGAALAAIPAMAQAADCPAGFPSQPIEFIVGYAAGGGTDAIGRVIASEIERARGWTVPVSNRPGAGGDVLMSYMRTRAPDGYIVGVSSTNTVTLDPFANEAVDFTYEDFDYLGSSMEVTFGLVALSSRPYSTLEEFIEYARSNGRATVSTSAIALEIAVERLADHFGVRLIPVPGGGASEALQSALGGHVDATLQGSQHIQQIESGNMRQLSTLVPNRVRYAPDTMTTLESGVNVTAGAHIIYVLPKGVDPAIAACLEEAIADAVNTEVYATLMENFDAEPINLGPQGTLDFIVTQAAEYEQVFAARNN